MELFQSKNLDRPSKYVIAFFMIFVSSCVMCLLTGNTNISPSLASISAALFPLTAVTKGWSCKMVRKIQEKIIFDFLIWFLKIFCFI